MRVRADRHMLGDQAMQPGALGQRQHRRKTAIRRTRFRSSNTAVTP